MTDVMENRSRSIFMGGCDARLVFPHIDVDSHLRSGAHRGSGFPKFFLVRAMFGLLLIILFLYLIAMRAELWALVRRLLDACAGKYGGSER